VSIRRVRKRDGREAPFQKEKIEAAVLSAQAAVGEDDPAFAREVGDLVELALRRRYAWTGPRPLDPREGLFDAARAQSQEGEVGTAPESVPEIEEIQDLVEVGLIELGHAEVAKAYILYRDRRARAREALGGVREGATGEASVLRHVRVREAEGTFPWSKSRIVAALVHEADLSREQAEDIALRVEGRVVASGTRRLSTALVRELVDNELVAMGLSGALARHAPVSVPRHDLREVLAAGPQDSAAAPGIRRSVVDLLGGELLRRFSQSDLLEDRIAEAHQAGELFVEDLCAPHLHLVQSIPSELLLRGEPGALAAFDALSEVANLCEGVSRGIVLEAPSALLQPLARASRGEGQASLTTWLLALAALARAAGKRVDLAGAGQRAPALNARLLRELDELDRSAEADSLARVFLSGEELEQALEHEPSLRDVADRLLARGLLVPTWSGAGSQFVGPACIRASREQGAISCGAAVALNLPKVAERAGPWREDLVLENVALLVEDAVEALARLSVFQREQRASRRGEARGRVSYALTPVGLREALRILGDGELRPEQGARLLGLMSDAARRFSAARGLAVTLTPCFGEAASRRFAALASGEARSHQGLLFDEGSVDASQRARSTPGYALGGGTGLAAGAAEAELLSTVPAGPWFTPLTGATGHLEAWERFALARREGHRLPSSPSAGPGAASLFQLDAC
jgi:hypothetical protein